MSNESMFAVNHKMKLKILRDITLDVDHLELDREKEDLIFDTLIQNKLCEIHVRSSIEELENIYNNLLNYGDANVSIKSTRGNLNKDIIKIALISNKYSMEDNL